MGISSDAAIGNKIMVVSHGKLTVFIAIRLQSELCLAKSH
ncbi:hypothetical protein NSP_11090 [Nodularia spumigena CCY9414]|nr:hypothetical protein NSP_11090 [Nodularia spumigena CCY9414]